MRTGSVVNRHFLNPTEGEELCSLPVLFRLTQGPAGQGGAPRCCGCGRRRALQLSGSEHELQSGLGCHLTPAPWLPWKRSRHCHETDVRTKQANAWKAAWRQVSARRDSVVFFCGLVGLWARGVFLTPRGSRSWEIPKCRFSD